MGCGEVARGRTVYPRNFPRGSIDTSGPAVVWSLGVLAEEADGARRGPDGGGRVTE